MVALKRKLQLCKICDASREGCLRNCLVQNHGDFEVNLHESQAKKKKKSVGFYHMEIRGIKSNEPQ